MTHEEIALGLGISRKTLEKHFEHELSVGAYAKRLEVLDAMQRTARRGNVAAQKAYLQLTPSVAAPPAQPGKDTDAAAATQKPEKIGKKERANADAQVAQVGTEWDELLRKPGTPLQ